MEFDLILAYLYAGLCFLCSFTSSSWPSSSLPTITPSQRRKERRERARARLKWHLHRQGIQFLDILQLTKLFHVLAKHHSKDTGLLRKVRSAMTSTTKDPWRCAFCKRLNKSVAAHCGKCETRWERCIDIYYVHGQNARKEQNWSYVDWEEEGTGWSGRQQSRGRNASNRRDSSRRRDQTPRGHKGKDSPRRRGPRKKGNKEEAFTFQTLGGQPPPWPTQETSFSTSSTGYANYAMPQAPLPPPSTPPPASPPIQVDASLVAAVRKEYPDLSKAPAEIREAMEKAETMSSQQIASALHRSTNRVRQSTDKLRALQESQRRHKESWHVHLKEAITSWESQVQAFTSQQNSFKDMMELTRAELQAARKEIQRLNHLAAGTGKIMQIPTVDLTEPEEIVIDTADSTALMEKMPSTLQKCSQIILDPGKGERAVSVPSDEDMYQPANKRQRSADPGAKDTALGGGSRGGGSS